MEKAAEVAEVEEVEEVAEVAEVEELAGAAEVVGHFRRILDLRWIFVSLDLRSPRCKGRRLKAPIFLRRRAEDWGLTGSLKVQIMTQFVILWIRTKLTL